MKNNPLVSVIIPTYNRSKTIGRAIKSVISQTYINWELIIIDDGSTDNTKNLIEPYLKYQKIVYVYQKNKGPSYARNIGINLARGDFITFLDSDDYYVRDNLKIRLKKMSEKNFNVSLTNALIRYPNKFVIKNKSNDKIVNFIDLLESNAGALISLMIKRSILKNLRFDETLSVAEDVDFILRFPCNTPILFISDPLLVVEKNLDGNRLSINLDRRIQSHKVMIKKICNHEYSLSELDKKILYKKLNIDLGISYALKERYSLAKSFLKKALKIKVKIKNGFRYRVIFFTITFPPLFNLLKRISIFFWNRGDLRA